MSQSDMNGRLDAYKKILSDGEFQRTYQDLVSVLQQVRLNFIKHLKPDYSIAGIMHGYVDFTYFYLQNTFLKQRKLKMAIVLNHKNVSFDLWLLGNTKDAQKAYWAKLKGSKWISSDLMPIYSIFETELVSSPNFDNLAALIDEVRVGFDSKSREILTSLSHLDAD